MNNRQKLGAALGLALTLAMPLLAADQKASAAKGTFTSTQTKVPK